MNKQIIIIIIKDPKTLEGRIFEIGLGAGAVYSINRFVLKHDLKPMI